MKNKNKGLLKKIIIEHISNNKKEYIIVLLMFVAGIFLGVFFINHIKEAQVDEIKNYFLTGIENLKQTQGLQMMELLKESVVRNVELATILWFLGTTIIGIPIVLGIIAYRGFCLGYTISCSILALGNAKGISFILAALLFHNILYIPAIVAIGVSGFKLYKSIVKDRKRQNIKGEILRHTIFSFLMALILVLSSVIESFGTTNFILLILKYL